MKYKYIAHYAADNQTEFFESLKDAKKWLQDFYDIDGPEGFSEETYNGGDCIAKITHRSNYKITDSKDNYPWSEEDEAHINKYGEIWPYSDDFDHVGIIELLEER